MAAEIPLTRGKVALVDEVDAEWLGASRWCAQWNVSGVWYAVRRVPNGGGRITGMHNSILPPLPGFEIDHINRDGLDNQRHNLRYATRSQNNMNHKVPCNNTSGVPGVGWHKQNGRWEARVWKDGKRIRLGLFRNFEDAVAARAAAEIEMYGEFSRLARQ